MTEKFSSVNSATQRICPPDAERDDKNLLELINPEENYEDAGLSNLEKPSHYC